VSALAKILGVYRVGFRNFITGAEHKQDVLVMENLFYGRKMGKVSQKQWQFRRSQMPQQAT